MLKSSLIATVVLSASCVFLADAAQAQCVGCAGGDWSTRDIDGMVQPTRNRLRKTEALKYAAQDHFSPNPIYAYSKAGLSAGHVHAWNQQQATANPWHGQYSHWKWGQPTALVVPPTAAYGVNYAWGVAQTRSTPIHHQFGRNHGYGVGSGFGNYPNTPYWPSDTNQFGIYSVRAPW